MRQRRRSLPFRFVESLEPRKLLAAVLADAGTELIVTGTSGDDVINVFLTTPAKGLRDLYGFAQVVVPWEVPIRLIYHKFDADSGGADFGQEVDLQASKKLGKNWTVLAKYSYYDGKEAPARFDVHKIWGQVEFNF